MDFSTYSNCAHAFCADIFQGCKDGFLNIFTIERDDRKFSFSIPIGEATSPEFSALVADLSDRNVFIQTTLNASPMEWPKRGNASTVQYVPGLFALLNKQWRKLDVANLADEEWQELQFKKIRVVWTDLDAKGGLFDVRWNGVTVAEGVFLGDGPNYHQITRGPWEENLGIPLREGCPIVDDILPPSFIEQLGDPFDRNYVLNTVRLTALEFERYVGNPLDAVFKCALDDEEGSSSTP